MVRVNLVPPNELADQHLVAEYREILLLAGYVERHPSLENLPKEYALGRGHMRFFKDKLGYLSKRHESIRAEMKKRGFTPRIRLSTKGFSRRHLGQWKPGKRDIEIAKRRLLQRLLGKPRFYRHYGKVMGTSFWRRMMNKGR